MLSGSMKVIHTVAVSQLYIPDQNINFPQKLHFPLKQNSTKLHLKFKKFISKNQDEHFSCIIIWSLAVM